MDNNENKEMIASIPIESCFLCKNKGKRLYEKLEDRLFGAPGEWNLNQCQNPKCGLIWLDPRPIKEDIHKAYNAYYTHIPESSNYQKKIAANNFLNIIIKGIQHLGVFSMRRKRLELMYLDKTKPGRLLEVGCGNGSRLALFKARGWDVVGQEIDPIAAKIAKSTCHCEVFVGELENLTFPESSFNAIIMSHVIEHVFDPISLLNECYRILKPNGQLILVTPNSDSFGHQYFRSNWLHLDPPRHLHVFSQKTLKNLATRCQLNVNGIFTTSVNAHLSFRPSFNIKRVGKVETKPIPTSELFKVGSLAIFESLAILIKKNCGEECLLMATKRF